MTVSRFETGRAEPRDPRVLLNLANAAKEIGLGEEHDMFAEAQLEAANPGYFAGSYGPFSARQFLAAAAGIGRDVRAWRLSAAARMAALYYPEQVAAVEKALGPALAIVDEALRTADRTRGLDYERLADRLEALGEQKVLADLDMKLKQQEKVQ
jgi:hypothetical protein